jgi:hypothetical protein
MIALLLALQSDWTKETWERAAVAEAARIRRDTPELAAKVDRPEGIDPAIYRKFRNPGPKCVRELRHLGKEAVPLLIERWKWTMGELTLTAEERAALEEAILQVPGLVGDARARWFLEEVLASDHRLRAHAAVSLGQIGATDAVLSTLDDRSQPLEIRQACARALGHATTTLDAIRARLGEDAVARDLLTALGLLGSAWAWEARKQDGSAIRQGCGETLLDQLRKRPSEAETIGRALALVQWSGTEEALRALEADRPEAVRTVRGLLRR